MNIKFLVENCYQNNRHIKGFTKKKAEEIIKGIFEDISFVLSKGESIQIKNVGTFEIIDRAPRVYIEPREGKKIKKGASKYPKFRPSAKLKELVNRK
jgi:DNA-binding protein HU-beta